ncbi:MAG: serine hydrolase [Bacteroidota bacterium]
MKIINTLLLTIVTGSIMAQVPQVINDKLNKTYDSICTKLNIKGSSAAILIPNVGIWKRNFGISHTGKSTDTEMLFTLGSNTKTYTATVILKLHQLGMLNINDTIGKWFNNVSNVNGTAKIQQLLNHTSGIASYTNNNTFWSTVNNDLAKPWTPEEILPYIPAASFAPGASWEYSNSNYLLAGIIIKQVTGKSLSEAYRTYIFNPLSLGKTFLPAEETTNMDVAHHWSTSIGNPYLTDWEGLGLSYVAMDKVSWAAGGLYATAEDNVKFFNALFNTKTIIADSMITKMKVTRNIGNGAAYGLGIFTYAGFNGRTVYSHGGSNLGGVNENLYDPVNSVSMSILTNQDSIDNDMVLIPLLYNLHKDLIALKVGVNNIENNISQNIKIYPNPSNGNVAIDIDQDLEDDITISIVDMSGKQIMDLGSFQKQNARHLKIDVSNLQKGIYLITGKSTNHTFTKKLMLVD